jgi:hypothetical protein
VDAPGAAALSPRRLKKGAIPGIRESSRQFFSPHNVNPNKTGNLLRIAFFSH